MSPMLGVLPGKTGSLLLTLHLVYQLTLSHPWTHLGPTSRQSRTPPYHLSAAHLPGGLNKNLFCPLYSLFLDCLSYASSCKRWAEFLLGRNGAERGGRWGVGEAVLLPPSLLPDTAARGENIFGQVRSRKTVACARKRSRPPLF